LPPPPSISNGTENTNRCVIVIYEVYARVVNPLTNPNHVYRHSNTWHYHSPINTCVPQVSCNLAPKNFMHF
jgi:hypothetical protein